MGVALAALALVATAQGALAGPGFSSRVTIHLKRNLAQVAQPRFFGKVRSERNACERGRKVVLFGQESGAPAERVDKTRTNRRGRWRIRHAVNFSNFYAEVKRSHVAAGPCRADVSRPLHVG
jgi:hypothetical protein